MRRDNGLDYDAATTRSWSRAAPPARSTSAALALLEPGDEVVLFEPYYGYHRNTLESLGVRPVYVPLAAPDFALDARARSSARSRRARARS